MSVDRVRIGVDGARDGWAVAAVDFAARVDLRRVDDLEDIFERWPAAEQIWVDIPIGLPFDDEVRACDTMARRALAGGRASSVFTPPCRRALEAENHEEASRINREVTGRGLSIQAWHLGAKILEVDALKRVDSKWTERIRESHPEVVFALLAAATPGWPSTSARGSLPVLESKKSAEGREQRIALLEHHLPGSAAALDAVAVPRAQVALDDWIDALGLAAAQHISRGRSVSWPHPPAADDHGVPMALAIPVS